MMDADIAAFFDRLDHTTLMTLVAKRIGDRRMLGLLKQWLQAGVLDGETLSPNDQGAPKEASSRRCWRMWSCTNSIGNGRFAAAISAN